ncbi:protoporphyrinogen oxidase HemJ [Phaeovulum vinaykumarii]|uniref:Protoporphyrinogen IX oxidase n=1 Tax=Phaeovulum vinaykumarii TaxID=407234 RepID=A0A1N7MAV8_9RHOB|nr:protoporphyrinogen oxidase HemJ [Phaeovulum vinaykumarii]SIS83197.1 putative membrane protein [Phaeovulum vinaykumarii]SOC10372.1 putative membrane protein [Phaeovulum vinaykumarii]
MGDFLLNWYFWIKAFHVMSVLAWMAGLFYLPRIYVYHVEATQPGTDTDATFKVMERKLLRAIMNPAAISTWFFGLLLVFTPGVIDWSTIWPWTKGFSIIAMTIFHLWLAARRKDFERGENTLSGRRYRMMNEIPTILMVIIVLSVLVKW